MFKHWIALLLFTCIVADIIVCSILVIKIRWLSSADLSVVLNVLSPAVTVIAIWVAYRAYQNQADTNKSNISKTTLNMLLSEISANRNALSTISYEQERGGKAANHFAKSFWLKVESFPDAMTDEQIDSVNELPAQDFIKQAIYQLEELMTTISSVKSNENKLEPHDLRKAQLALKSLMQDCFLQYNPVFERLIISVKNGRTHQNGEVKGLEFRSNMFSTFTRSAKRYIEIRQELMEYGYVEKTVFNPKKLSANLLAQERADVLPKLDREITSLDESPHKLSDM